jgi:Holliday junction resolvase RusA-like endonuclease
MMVEFFMPIIPPTTTFQQKEVTVTWNKKKKKHIPRFYESAELKAARAKLTAHLAKHVPKQKYTSGIRLITKWLFPITGKHQDGEYKTTKPDTDNLQKLLKDVMTDLGYWTDDALVASEITEKFWAELPGIYIKIEEIE